MRHNGRRIRKSTATSVKADAQRYHDNFKRELWEITKLNKGPRRTWQEAVVKWSKQKSHKKSFKDDLIHLKFLHPFLHALYLDEIDKEMIELIIDKKKEDGVQATKKNDKGEFVKVKVRDIKNSSVNRMLEVLRAILNKAVEWDWLDKAPKFEMLVEDNKRDRWLKPEEVHTLLRELPEHVRAMTIFSLSTGLRQANVLKMKWVQIDFKNSHAFVTAKDVKTKSAIPVPLNKTAMEILKGEIGNHPEYVFTYKGRQIKSNPKRAWRNALKRAGIENFRWHDLRHTWASWLVQNGTPLHELQQLGGWSSYQTVLRYAHLNSDHLKEAAGKLDGVFGKKIKKVDTKRPQR